MQKYQCRDTGSTVRRSMEKGNMLSPENTVTFWQQVSKDIDEMRDKEFKRMITRKLNEIQENKDNLRIRKKVHDMN
jgi:hypothetical protein